MGSGEPLKVGSGESLLESYIGSGELVRVRSGESTTEKTVSSEEEWVYDLEAVLVARSWMDDFAYVAASFLTMYWYKV